MEDLLEMTLIAKQKQVKLKIPMVKNQKLKPQLMYLKNYLAVANKQLFLTVIKLFLFYVCALCQQDIDNFTIGEIRYLALRNLEKKIKNFDILVESLHEKNRSSDFLVDIRNIHIIDTGNNGCNIFLVYSFLTNSNFCFLQIVDTKTLYTKMIFSGYELYDKHSESAINFVIRKYKKEFSKKNDEEIITFFVNSLFLNRSERFYYCPKESKEWVPLTTYFNNNINKNLKIDYFESNGANLLYIDNQNFKHYWLIKIIRRNNFVAVKMNNIFKKDNKHMLLPPHSYVGIRLYKQKFAVCKKYYIKK